MKKGFTLIELLVIVAIVAILLAIVAPIGCQAFGGRRQAAEQKWTEHLQKSYPDYTIVNAECVATDSDNDGYISCTATLKTSSGDTVEKNMECNSGGCRVPKPSGYRY